MTSNSNMKENVPTQGDNPMQESKYLRRPSMRPSLRPTQTESEKLEGVIHKFSSRMRERQISLQDVLRNPEKDFFPAFLKHTKREYCQENSAFWLSVESYKHKNSILGRVLKLDMMYTWFLYQNSPFAVNLSAEHYMNITKNLQNIFDDAQKMTTDQFNTGHTHEEFWTAVKNYKTITNISDLIHKLKEIHYSFLDKEMSHGTIISEAQEQSIMDRLYGIFNETQGDVYNLMKYDTYPRFLEKMKKDPESK